MLHSNIHTSRNESVIEDDAVASLKVNHLNVCIISARAKVFGLAAAVWVGTVNLDSYLGSKQQLW